MLRRDLGRSHGGRRTAPAPRPATELGHDLTPTTAIQQVFAEDRIQVSTTPAACFGLVVGQKRFGKTSDRQKALQSILRLDFLSNFANGERVQTM